jgi:1,4-alpha-glucan branching enzyme
VTASGAFTFVLHSHLPYARQAGFWPHGEEWVHEAIAETYVPLLNALTDLAEEKVKYRITIGITPILAEQLADELIKDHFVTFASERIEWSGADIQRFESAGDHQMAELARFFNHWYTHILQSYTERFQRDLVGAFKKLQDQGHVEVATSAATHGYLPLLSRDSSIWGQLQTGVSAYTRHFGRAPKAIWLPECAYRPAFEETEEDGAEVRRPGLESFLAAQNLEVFFSETHTVEGGSPVGKAAGEAIGAYGEVSRRYSVDLTNADLAEPGTTYLGYWVGDAAGKVAVLGRNNRTSQQVWSGTFGYPGDSWYREFHRKDGVSGMQYWRIGGPGVDLGEKPTYEPDRAAERVADHARHFVGMVNDLLQQFHDDSGQFGIIASNYDTELFGHWWFEGVEWIKQVLRGLAESEQVELTTASRYIEHHAPERVLALPESSWGMGGNHFTWMNVDTRWMWDPIHKAEEEMETLVEAQPDAKGDQLRVLQQAARELLLLESSDWPFLVTTGQAKEYAERRFSEHADRFHWLASLAKRNGELSADERQQLADLEDRDNPFPQIDYRAFAARQGSAKRSGATAVAR